MKTTPTPRTDAVTITFHDTAVVPPAFARQLERELAAALEHIRKLTWDRDRADDLIVALERKLKK